MLSIALMYSTTQEKLEFTGISYLIDSVWQGEEEADPSKISTILEEDKKDAKYKYVEIFGYRIKEMKLMGHL